MLYSIPNEWMNEKAITLSFIKIYISLSLSLERSEIGRKCVRDRRGWRSWTQAGGGLLYWRFLNPWCDSIALRTWFFDGRSSTGVHRCCLLPTPGTRRPLSESLDSPNLFSLTETDRSVCGYPCIYHFITPMLPFGSWCTWSASGC